MAKPYPSQQADGFGLRMPDGMRPVIKETAARNRRSMNAEIIFHLEAIYGDAMREAAGQSRAA